MVEQVRAWWLFGVGMGDWWLGVVLASDRSGNR